VINDLWQKNAIIYSLSVGTYMDANGDGIGDFNGLTRRLDYLQGLGVTTIWLMPFQTSPGRDDGYDIADYYRVDPRYGTLGDFVEFTHACRQRGIRLLIDLVVNHTSPAPLVFGRAQRSELSLSRLVRLGRQRAGQRPRRRAVFRRELPSLFTIVNPTSIPPIRTSRPRSSRSRYALLYRSTVCHAWVNARALAATCATVAPCL
jgi:maltose alpha-D-glucosyltransferase/alpha-amylase